MSTNDYITDVTANRAEWGIDYRETTEGVNVGTIHLEISEGDTAATITNGDDGAASRSDADGAAALLARPLARKAWVAGYMGDFEIDTLNGEMDMRLSYGSSDVTISAAVDSGRDFTVTEHPLLRENVDMTDLEAALESTQLAYQAPVEAWQVLCGATDFEHDDWEMLVERFHWQARFDSGDRLTKVSTSESNNVALVEDYGPESPIRVIDVDAMSDVACWSPGDVAGAVLYAIS